MRIVDAREVNFGLWELCRAIQFALLDMAAKALVAPPPGLKVHIAHTSTSAMTFSQGPDHNRRIQRTQTLVKICQCWKVIAQLVPGTPPTRDPKGGFVS